MDVKIAVQGVAWRGIGLDSRRAGEHRSSYSDERPEESGRRTAQHKPPEAGSARRPGLCSSHPHHRWQYRSGTLQTTLHIPLKIVFDCRPCIPQSRKSNPYLVFSSITNRRGITFSSVLSKLRQSFHVANDPFICSGFCRFFTKWALKVYLLKKLVRFLLY